MNYLARGVYQLNCTTQEADFRVPLQEVDLFLEAVRHSNVISVHPGNVYACGKLDSDVQRYCPSLVFVAQDAHSSVPARVAHKDFRCSVSRAVVDNEEFEV